MAISFAGLLIPVVFFIVLGIVIAMIASRGKAKVVDPSCGKCGYNVHGLTTFNCPECGGDLREVGIVTPYVESPGGAFVKNIIGWSAAVVLFAFCCGGFAMALFSRVGLDLYGGIYSVLGIAIAIWMFGTVCMVRDYMRQRRV